VAVVDLPLQVGHGRAVTLVIERRSFDERDTLRGTLRLVSAVLLPRGGPDG
jgi:hypothetical protein